MNGTPRLRSAFPDTPKTEPGEFRPRRSFNSTPSRPPPPRRSVIRPSPLLNARPLKAFSTNEPVISLDFIDGPTQRLYVAAFYIALVAWKLYNAVNISEDSEVESTWLFLKWTAIDAAFLLALPAFRIPWLEWSFLTTMVIWLLHTGVNLFLMYRITLPISGLMGAVVKMAYDRELSLSDHRVKAADILHNSSIILGKQIINLLPEGSAVLNPDKQSFCLDATRVSVELPIRINQTIPESIELLRYDLDSDEVETILIGAKQARKLKAAADKGHEKHDTNTPRTLRYPASKAGLYQLHRVVDKSKLEVRRRSFDVAVVPCPQASVSASLTDRCMGDLSGISLHVKGVPPFKVRYSKRINQQTSSVTQSIQPPESDQDLPPDAPSDVVVDPRRPQMGWTQSTSMSVDINESLHQNGTWSYAIEEVEDGLANKVTFDSESMTKAMNTKISQSIVVHKRPQINLAGCDGERFLRVAREKAIAMPLQIRPKGQLPPSDWPLKLKYTFTAETEDGIPAIEDFERELPDEQRVPTIGKAGRYDITSIESRFCQGEVNEPSSCLLSNPPRPSMSWDSKEIFDKCAGRPIGMTVNLDFTGTPPFRVTYEVSKAGERTVPKVAEFKTMRGQLDFQEQSAGSYTYQLVGIEDDVYDPISIRGSQNTIQQDIRPSADALFKGDGSVTRACLGQSVSFGIRMLGEGPWDLEYELVHAGKRKKLTVHSANEEYTIEIPGQSEGGKYSLILTGIQDASHCRTPLNEERTIEVRTEQPRASFGDIDRRWTIETLEGKAVKLPLKLKGTAPWAVQIQNIESGQPPREYVLRDANSVIQAESVGTYQIVGVRDTCPGIADPKANQFHVSWVQRPSLQVKDSTTTESKGSNVLQKRPVCQGDEDVLNLALSGHPPYRLNYQVKSELSKGQNAIKNEGLSVASGSAVIHMHTSKAGHYTYTFNQLADDRYDHSKGHFAPLVIKQEVFPPPTAKFQHPGKTYGHCWDEAAPPSEAESENIPIVLTGEPPFAVDIAITHHGGSGRPEIVRVRDIATNSYSWTLSRASLGVGTHSLQIRAVKDSRGCETLVDSSPSTVRIHVSQPPAIIPLEATTDYCVGDHLSFSLSGQPPFDIFYNFQNRDRKAHVTSNEFKRISDYAGDFIITGVSDSAMGAGGKCKAKKDIRKTIHPYPTVRISHGKTLTSDIHEGGEVEIVFEFTGTPPFEFTYTRSENAKKGRKAQVLETRHDTSTEFTKIVRASDEGTYEVVAIKDRYCAYSAPGLAKTDGGKGQKLLT